MKLLPAGLLQSSHPLQSCPGCGRLTKDPVCGYCLQQLSLVQEWILESCALHSQGFRPLVRSLAHLGVSELMVKSALLKLLIDGQLVSST